MSCGTFTSLSCFLLLFNSLLSRLSHRLLFLLEAMTERSQKNFFELQLSLNANYFGLSLRLVKKHIFVITKGIQFHLKFSSSF